MIQTQLILGPHILSALQSFFQIRFLEKCCLHISGGWFGGNGVIKQSCLWWVELKCGKEKHWKNGCVYLLVSVQYAWIRLTREGHAVSLCACFCVLHEADAPCWWSSAEPQYVLSVPHAFLLPSSHLPDSGPGLHSLCATPPQLWGQQQRLLWDHGNMWVPHRMFYPDLISSVNQCVSKLSSRHFMHWS